MTNPKTESLDSAAGELKPCPFCGATDGRLVQAFTRATDDFAYWSVECLDCGVEVADDESQEAADRAWNRRAIPPMQDQGDEAHTTGQERALNPCPFCCGRAVMRRDDDPSYPWYVTFDHADICPMYAVPTDLFRSYPTEAEAVIAWTPNATSPALQVQGLCDALERIAGKNDLSGVPDDEVEGAARYALYECELIARDALSLPRQPATDEGEGRKLALAFDAWWKLDQEYNRQVRYGRDPVELEERLNEALQKVHSLKDAALSTPTSHPPAAETRLREALEKIEGRVGDASRWWHNSQQWHEEDACDMEEGAAGKVWDWIFRDIRAALTQPEPVVDLDPFDPNLPDEAWAKPQPEPTAQGDEEYPPFVWFTPADNSSRKYIRDDLAAKQGGEELPYQSDDWKLRGYPNAAAEIEDMANVGRALMQAIEKDYADDPFMKGWHPADCPTEIVGDLLNALDEALSAQQAAGEAVEICPTCNGAGGDNNVWTCPRCNGSGGTTPAGERQ